MATDFKLPELGENIDSGDVVNLMVSEGDTITANQNIMEVETGKAVVDIPCPFAGKITKLHVKKGDSVAVGAVLISVEEGASGDSDSSAKKPKKEEPAAEEEASPKEEKAKKKPATKEEAKKPQKPAPADDEDDDDEEPAPPKRAAAAKSDKAAASSNGGPSRSKSDDDTSSDKPAAAVAAAAGPATRRLARELGVDLQRVTGSGPGGRITREDVVAAVRQGSAAKAAGKSRRASGGEGVEDQDSWGPIRRQNMSRMRKAIAESMQRTTSIPMLTNFDDADITEIERIRKGSMADSVGAEVKLTMLAFLIKACALSLKAHPTINASIDLEAGEIVYKDYANIGIAVDTERGLVVPVMRDVDSLSIPQIAAALTEMAKRTRTGKFSLEETQGGSFTISNLGSIGGTYSTPIINGNEVAILLAGRSRKLPVVIEDRIEPRLMMPLSLTYDHRLVDGANAGRFLNEVKNYLQNPGRLLLAT